MDTILHAFLELLLEVALKGPGYLILRLFRPKEQIDTDDWLVLLIGTAFWGVVVFAIWVVVAIW